MASIKATVKGLPKKKADVAIAIMVRGVVNEAIQHASGKELSDMLEKMGVKLSEYIQENLKK